MVQSVLASLPVSFFDGWFEAGDNLAKSQKEKSVNNYPRPDTSEAPHAM